MKKRNISWQETDFHEVVWIPSHSLGRGEHPNNEDAKTRNHPIFEVSLVCSRKCFSFATKINLSQHLFGKFHEKQENQDTFRWSGPPSIIRYWVYSADWINFFLKINWNLTEKCLQHPFDELFHHTSYNLVVCVCVRRRFSFGVRIRSIVTVVRGLRRPAAAKLNV